MGTIGMKSQSYKLNPELNNGLIKYGEDNNLSPISIIEELVEDFLCRNEYLGVEMESTPPKIEKIKYADYDKRSESYGIRKSINGKRKRFGASKSPRIVKDIIKFLESKDWDLKYAVSNTGLMGEKQINFLLGEMEKEQNNE